MSFPGLERCEHGEYADRDCVKCELDRLRKLDLKRNTLLDARCRLIELTRFYERSQGTNHTVDFHESVKQLSEVIDLMR